MIRKFISIKNIGRFLNTLPPRATQIFLIIRLLSAANGFGKTTLCAVLRLLKTGDPAHIMGRQTLVLRNSQALSFCSLLVIRGF